MPPTGRVVTLSVVLSLSGVALPTPVRAHGDADPPTRPAPTGRVTLPQAFIEQDDGFVLAGDGLAARFGTGRLHWILSAPADGGTLRRVVTVEPVGGRADTAPVGERPLPGVVSRFSGPESEWRRGDRTFAALRYADLWPGIDLVLEAEHQTLKGTWVVSPGADPATVRLRHHGADAIRLDADGDLVVHTAAGDLVDAAPVAWQHVDGARRDVPVRFVLEAAADAGSGPFAHGDHRDPAGPVDVTFALGAHDPDLPLLIDPAVIVQAGFLGGAEDDVPGGIEVDADGCVYVGGRTMSSELTFPTVVGPDLTFGGPVTSTGGDIYVAKLDPTGTTLIYAGFLGGTDGDALWDTALDDQGRLYIGGNSKSTPAEGFPALVGPSVNHNGSADGIVARVSADGTTLEYCGYIGGNGTDFVAGIDVDDSGRAWVVGRFDSIHSTLPIHGGPFTSQPGGSYDGFVARVRADGFWHDFCGYLGGDDIEDITQVVADDGGGAWFTGYTWSQDFPTVGGLGPVGNGSIDAIIGRVAPDGLSLTACGFLGGTASEYPQDIALDAAGAIYVAGVTYDAFSFPAAVGPELLPSAAYEGFVLKLAPGGESVDWAGFTNTGNPAYVRVDDTGAPWVLSWLTGSTSTDRDPVLARVAAGGTGFDLQQTFDLPEGCFFAKFAPVPSALTPGGPELWLAGSTTATEATFPVVGALDPTHNGEDDTVLMRVRFEDGTWTDLGFSLAGTHGDPLLVADGPLAGGSTLTISLSGALESTTAWLVYGPDTLFAPFGGGTLVPAVAPPNGVLTLPTSPAGTLDLATPWPPGVPAGFELHLQYWIDDPAGPAGLSASNAVRGTTP